MVAFLSLSVTVSGFILLSILTLKLHTDVIKSKNASVGASADVNA
jgi:hypothetical protein